MADLSCDFKDTDVYIKNIYLEGVHNRYKLNVDFNRTLSVLHGQNGSGKTTLLHAIANIANCDFLRFSFIEFKFVKVSYSNGNWVSIKKSENLCVVECALGDRFEFDPLVAAEMLKRSDDDRYIKSIVNENIQEQTDFSKRNKLDLVKTSYFPAFRTILEAWSAQIENDFPPTLRGRQVSTTRKVTEFSRNLFGQFLPKINFPSPQDIESGLKNELRDAQIKIGRYDSSVFTDSFVKVFSALLSGEQGRPDEAEVILKEISELTSVPSNLDIEGPSQDTYSQLQRLIESGGRTDALTSSAVGALKVYRDALKARKSFQSKIFDEIDKYFYSVNAFLDKKKKELRYEIDPTRRNPKVGLRFPDNSWSNVLVMSSGERQLLTMLYAVTKMNEDTLVLIDEPELSLHIDWQEELLGKMVGQLGGRQIIVCTHSPSIAKDYNDHMIEISPDFDLNTASQEVMVTTDDDEELI